MKRNILCTAAVTAACLMLAACQKNPGTAISDPSSSTAGTAPVVVETPAPTPTLPPYEANVLTGEPKGDDYPEGQRITTVMVNNIVAARPQRGLSRAQMLFEIKVEGGITRFMPVYNDYHDIEEVGPVRSGRDQFFQLLLPWQALYIHEGESVVMTQYAKDYNYGPLNNTNGAYGYRDKSRVNWAGKSYNNGLAIEHTMYTSGENIAKYIEDAGVDMNRTYNSTFFNFCDYRTNEVRDLTQSPDSDYINKYGDPVVSDGEYVEITHSQSYKTRFVYDSASNTYKMQQNYSDGQWRNTVDELYDQQLEFPNLIVLYTDIHTYQGHEAKDLQCVDYSFGGVGYYCYGGKCEMIYWQKGTPLEALQLYYLDENTQCSDELLKVNTGKSYVAVVDNDFTANFVAKSLDGVDLSAYGVATTETQHEDADTSNAGQSSAQNEPQPPVQSTTQSNTNTPSEPVETTPVETEAPSVPAGNDANTESSEGNTSDEAASSEPSSTENGGDDIQIG